MTTVTSPVAGRSIGLAAVPDPVFSGAMVGPGTAVDPVREPSVAVAPVDGIIVSCTRTPLSSSTRRGTVC